MAITEVPDDLKAHVAELRADLERRVTDDSSTPTGSAIRGDGVALGALHTSRIDELLLAMFARTEPPAGTRLSLAAVGSYGRGALALRSDVDLRVITSTRRAFEGAEALARSLLYPLWDAGLAIGHQVVDADEALALAQDDLATATSLLDLRHLAGDRGVTEDLQARAFAGLFSEGELGRFVQRLEDEATLRHERFGGSVYLLEPDVKNGAGGLRDLDVARWASLARFHVGVGRGGGEGPQAVWFDLVRLGVLVHREAAEIAAAEELLWRIRNRLHAYAKRRSDRLTFDAQEALGTALGHHAEDRAAAAEGFMQDYYLHARVVSRAREQLLSRATPPKKRVRQVIEKDLGQGLVLFDGHVSLHLAALAQDPALALRVYTACSREQAPILPFAREAIVRAARDPAFGEALRGSREARALFMSLLCNVADAPVKGGSILRELHDTGLLLAMIPEFAPVTGRVHHDVYHVYTVDVHSVAAVDALRALCRGEGLSDHPLASRLAAEIARPEPLFLATLLHDVGKGYPDADGSRKNHSKVGADMCDVIAPRLGLSQEDTEDVKALVLEHLAMYHTAARRDLDDPRTCEEFSGHVRGPDGLRNLYLLTVVDLTTTSPTALTKWKGQMLDTLYLLCDAYLEGRGGAKSRDARMLRTADHARSRWMGSARAMQAYLSSMPDRYVLANTADAICAHAEVVLARKDRPVHAAQVPSRHGGFGEVCVVARDRPGLLARIAAALTASRLEVLGADVYSRRVASGTEAVDLFWVKGRGDGPLDLGRLLPRLVGDLTQVCEGAIHPRDLLRDRLGDASPWRERPSPAIATEVVIDDRASSKHTVIEVFTKDRPGLLYVVAQALADLRLSISLSKINTEGTKVADVFYVQEIDGSKVTGDDRFKAIRAALLSALTEDQARPTAPQGAQP